MRRKQRDKAGCASRKATAAIPADTNVEKSRSEWLTLKEVSEQYDTPVGTLRYLIGYVGLPATNIGAIDCPEWRISRADFEDYEKQRDENVKQAILDLGKLLS